MARDDRGGLARSSDEFREIGGSEGANMLRFKIIHNLKRNDELLRNKITANNPSDGLAILLESESQ